jgi:uncharacterized membrane protein
MKKILEFLKTSAIGGLFILLPVLLLYLLLKEIFDLVVELATPIADLFPKDTFEVLHFPTVMAMILILGVSFLLGLTLHSSALRGAGSWIERRLLDPIPGYKALKSLTGGFAKAGRESAFRSALLNSPDGTAELVYVVEELADGRVTVLVPWSPASFAGVIKIVEQDSLRILDASLGKASEVVAHWGVGMGKLLNSERASTRDKRKNSAID